MGLVLAEHQVFEVGHAILVETSAVSPPAPSAAREHWVPSALCGKWMGALVGETLGFSRRPGWEILLGAPQSSPAIVGRQCGKTDESGRDISHQNGCRPPSVSTTLTHGGAWSCPGVLACPQNPVREGPCVTVLMAVSFCFFIQLWSPSKSYLVLQLIACKHSGKRLQPPDFSY